MTLPAPMLERIARFLCVRDGGDPDKCVLPPIGNAVLAQLRSDADTRPAWQGYAEEARRLLMLMREPDDAMRDAGGDRDRLGYDPAPGDVWQAMIDEARGA